MSHRPRKTMRAARKLLFPALACVVALEISLPATVGSARADNVVLRDGRQVQGISSEQGDEIIVKRKHGEVRFPKGDVLRIEKEDDVYSQLERKQKELGQGTAEERYQLGAWCRDHAFESEARDAFLSVLRLDP